MKWNVLTDGYLIATVPDCNLHAYTSAGWCKVCPAFNDYPQAKEHADKLVDAV